MNAYWRARLEDCIYGRAWRPYVTRVLIPQTVRLFAAAIPDPVRQPFGDFVRQHWPDTRDDSPARDYPVESGITALLLFGSLLGFGEVMRRLARQTLGLSGPWSCITSLAALLFLPGTYMYFSPAYDPATLLLFAAGLLFTFQNNLKGYLVVFLLATLNKETAILLTVVWAVWNRRTHDLRRWFSIILLQVGIWLLLRGGLLYIFRHNPGTPLEWHLDRNIAHLTDIRSYFSFRPSARFVPRGLNIIYLAALALIAARFRRLPLSVRLSSLILVPLVAAAFCFGLIDELRDYYEAYPGLILALAATVLPSAGRAAGTQVKIPFAKEQPGR